MSGLGVGEGQEKFHQVTSSFIPKQRKQTQPQGPKGSRRLPLSTEGGPPRPESASIYPLPTLPTQGACPVTPIPTPRAQYGKRAQGQSIKTNTPVGKRKPAEGSSWHLLTEPTNWTRVLERKVKTSSIPHCPQHPVINWTAFKKLLFQLSLLSKTDAPLCSG